MKKRKIIFKEDYLFLVMVCAIFIFGMYGFIKSPRKISTVENRTLAQFSHMTIKDFLSGEFQNNFEGALSDQFPKSESIRVGYGQIINSLPEFGLDKVVCVNRYIDVPSSTKSRSRFFDCGDYMLPYPMVMDKYKAEIYEKHINNYNRINKLTDVYYYFVLDANTRDFEKGEVTVDLENMLEKDLVGNAGLAFFKVDNYEKHKRYFYKTDHHWNYMGSYEGYKEIIDMFNIKAIEEPDAITNHDIFMGSFANAALYFNIKEEFNFYDFEFPEHDTYIDGKKSEYGHLQDYKNHNYPENVTSYYSYVYGESEGEVMFDYHNPEAENLLIISNSFGNPIKSLIAQHFNKTYAVDLRGYKKEMGKDFVIEDYIKERRITKVLFVMTYSFLFGEEQNQGLEL